MTIKAAADAYGCHYQQWQAWEHGLKVPSADALAKIANVLNCSIIKFFETGEDDL